MSKVWSWLFYIDSSSLFGSYSQDFIYRIGISTCSSHVSFYRSINRAVAIYVFRDNVGVIPLNRLPVFRNGCGLLTQAGCGYTFQGRRLLSRQAVCASACVRPTGRLANPIRPNFRLRRSFVVCREISFQGASFICYYNVQVKLSRCLVSVLCW